MGDLNARVGVDRAGYEEVLGKYGNGSRNKEGDDLLRMCARNGLRVMNSRFQKEKKQLITRYAWDGASESVIDYII